MKPCGTRLQCGHLCPFKVGQIPLSSLTNTHLSGKTSVTPTIHATSSCSAPSRVGGSVLEDILVTSFVPPHAAIVNTKYPKLNFLAVISRTMYLGTCLSYLLGIYELILY